MNKRVFLIGLAGGLLVSAALYYPLYLYLPSAFVESWPKADFGLAKIWTAAAASLLLLTGIFAARFSGTPNRLAAVRAGAAAGVTAALLAEILIGGAAAGVWGSRLALAHGLHATRDEAEFLGLLTHSVSSTIWWTYLSIWIAAAAGVLLGALGGLVAGPGGKPAQATPELWLVVSAIGALSSAVMLVVMAAVYLLLGPIIEKAAVENGIRLPYPSESLLNWPVYTNLAWLVFWQSTGWLILRAYPANRNASFLLRTVLSIIGGFILLYIVFLFSPIFIGNLALFIICALTLLALGFGILWLVMNKMPPLSVNMGKFGAFQSWYRGVGFLHRLGDARRTAWYFLAVAVLTTALLLLNRPQLLASMWVDGGLAIVLLLAILGIRDTWKKIPNPEEAPPVIGVKEYFSNTALSMMFPVFIATLNSLAPLNIVLISIVMIAPLMYTEEWQAVAQVQGQSLTGIVQSSYFYPMAYPIVMGFFLIISITFVTAYRLYWHKRRLRYAPADPTSTT